MARDLAVERHWLMWPPSPLEKKVGVEGVELK
jgi:hypothetical protein